MAALALGAAVSALGAGGLASGVSAQPFSTVEVPSPILTIDQDRLFLESAFGQRVRRDIEDRSSALAAENREIETALVAEELALTRQRDTLEVAEFRALAAAFDEKVRGLRGEQDAKSRALTRLGDEAQQVFLREIADVLRDMVRARGAVAILDRRAVFLAADAIDITDDAIRQIDAQTDAGDVFPVPSPLDLDDLPVDDPATVPGGAPQTPAPDGPARPLPQVGGQDDDPRTTAPLDDPADGPETGPQDNP